MRCCANFAADRFMTMQTAAQYQPLLAFVQETELCLLKYTIVILRNLQNHPGELYFHIASLNKWNL